MIKFLLSLSDFFQPWEVAFLVVNEHRLQKEDHIIKIVTGFHRERFWIHDLVRGNEWRDYTRHRVTRATYKTLHLNYPQEWLSSYFTKVSSVSSPLVNSLFLTWRNCTKKSPHINFSDCPRSMLLCWAVMKQLWWFKSSSVGHSRWSQSGEELIWRCWCFHQFIFLP